MKRDLGLRLIVAYKLGKGVAEVGLGAALGVMWWLGLTPWLQSLAHSLVHHLVHRWSIALGDALLRHATPHLFHLVVFALILDGVVALFEGWALHRRYRWGEWLVVVATGGLVPFEIRELVREPRAGRVLLLVVNLAVVAYLALRLVREHRRHPTNVGAPGAAPSASPPAAS